MSFSLAARTCASDKRKYHAGVLFGALLASGIATSTIVRADPVTVEGFPTETLQIMVPSAPGGGMDTASREIQKLMREQDIAAQALEVVNEPGGGQTNGLARLLSQYPADAHTVLVMGFGLVGGIHLNQATVNLDNVTPLARLTTDYLSIAVANESKYQTVQQLLEDFKKDPKSIVWGGGPGGSPDHLATGFMAKALGIDPKLVNYVAFSGSEPRAAIMGNQVTAGIISYGELKADAEAGLLRLLAVTSSERYPDSDVPTLKESGLDLEVANWRGIIAGPDVPDAQRDAWIEMLTRVHDSQAWQDTLATRGWTDAFLVGEPFGAYIKEEDARIGGMIRELGLVN